MNPNGGKIDGGGTGKGWTGKGRTGNGGGGIKKPFRFLSLGCMAVGLMISIPAARTGDSLRAADTLIAPVTTDSMAPRSATVERLRLELDTLGRRIEALNSRLAQAGAKAGEKVKNETREEVAALERAKDRLAARIDSLGGATSEAWLKMKARAKSGMDSLKADVDRLRGKYRD